VGKRDKKPKQAAPEKPKETTAEFIASMASVLVTGLFIITFIVQAFEIPSSSMENTLLIGDHVFVDRERFAPPTKWVGPLLPYREPKRNDIVVFVSVDTPGMYIVKRIVGLPGDHLRVVGGDLYSNGEKLSESYVVHKDSARPEDDYTRYRDYFPKFPPPPGMDLPQEWILTMGSHIQGGEIVVPPDEGRQWPRVSASSSTPPGPGVVAPRTGRGGGARWCRQQQVRVLGQNASFQLPQFDARLNPQLVGQQLAHPAHRGQCIHLAAAPVQPEGQQGPAPLPIRARRDRRSQSAHRASGIAHGQSRGGLFLERHLTQFEQPGAGRHGLPRAEPGAGQVGERLASPQR